MRDRHRVGRSSYLAARLVRHYIKETVAGICAVGVLFGVICVLWTISSSIERANQQTVEGRYAGYSLVGRPSTDEVSDEFLANDRVAPVWLDSLEVTRGDRLVDTRATILGQQSIEQSGQPRGLGVLVAGRHASSGSEVSLSRNLAVALGSSVGDEVNIVDDGERVVTGIFVLPGQPEAMEASLAQPDRQHDERPDYFLLDSASLARDDFGVVPVEITMDEDIYVANGKKFVGRLRVLSPILWLTACLAIVGLLSRTGRAREDDCQALLASGVSHRQVSAVLGIGAGAVVAVGLVLGFVVATALTIVGRPYLGGLFSQFWAVTDLPVMEIGLALATLAAALVAGTAFGGWRPPSLQPDSTRRTGSGSVRSFADRVPLTAALACLVLALLTLLFVDRLNAPSAVRLLLLALVVPTCALLASMSFGRLAFSLRYPPSMQKLLRAIDPLRESIVVLGLAATLFVSFAVVVLRAEGMTSSSDAQPPGSMIIRNLDDERATELAAMYRDVSGNEATVYSTPFDDSAIIRRVLPGFTYDCVDRNRSDLGRAMESCSRGRGGLDIGLAATVSGGCRPTWPDGLR